MLDEAKDLWKFAPVVSLLLLVLWAGYKGYWYWGGNAKHVLDEMRRDRDHWRELALKLMQENKSQDAKAWEEHYGSKKK